MDIERFLQLVVKSRLLDSDAVHGALDEFLGGSRAPYSNGSDLVAFADYLVYRRLLTRWQSQLLLDGWHEFFLGQFKFLKRIGIDQARESYLVEDTTANSTLILSFPSRPTGMAGTIYQIMTPIEFR